jgi:hypothetical protein
MLGTGIETRNGRLSFHVSIELSLRYENTYDLVGGGGSIALSTDFIEKHGLPGNAAATEEDPDKKIYLIAGYHQLHCLVRDYGSALTNLKLTIIVCCSRCNLLLERHND